MGCTGEMVSMPTALGCPCRFSSGMDFVGSKAPRASASSRDSLVCCGLSPLSSFFLRRLRQGDHQANAIIMIIMPPDPTRINIREFERWLDPLSMDDSKSRTSSALGGPLSVGAGSSEGKADEPVDKAPEAARRTPKPCWTSKSLSVWNVVVKVSVTVLAPPFIVSTAASRTVMVHGGSPPVAAPPRYDLGLSAVHSRGPAEGSPSLPSLVK